MLSTSESCIPHCALCSPSGVDSGPSPLWPVGLADRAPGQSSASLLGLVTPLCSSPASLLTVVMHGSPCSPVAPVHGLL